MKASVVQSLMARNRSDIRTSEWFLEKYKKLCKKHPDDESVGSWWDSVKRHKKEIKKLVFIQKELKKELQLAYRLERAERLSELIPDIFLFTTYE
jgi:hypothetical protein